MFNVLQSCLLQCLFANLGPNLGYFPKLTTILIGLFDKYSHTFHGPSPTVKQGGLTHSGPLLAPAPLKGYLAIPRQSPIQEELGLVYTRFCFFQEVIKITRSTYLSVLAQRIYFIRYQLPTGVSLSSLQTVHIYMCVYVWYLTLDPNPRLIGSQDGMLTLFHKKKVQYYVLVDLYYSKLRKLESTLKTWLRISTTCVDLTACCN